MLGSLASKEQLRITPVSPNQTDAQINTFTTDRKMHVVYFDPLAVKRNELFLFLPGTNGTGFGAPELNKTAALLGYHVLSLMYPDSIALARYRELNNPEMYAQGREEIITGNDVSKEFNVTRANSIENRLIKLLLYLSDKYPTENWQQFLNRDMSIAWEKIAVAGQSQGGGHAAFIAKKHVVARVLMFASPKDYSTYFMAPASWLSWISKTPVNRYFTFVHSDDGSNGCTYPQQVEIWSAMGLTANWVQVNVDSVSAPYLNSHILTSTKQQSFPHGAVISDAGYREVWKYMMTAD